MQSRAVRLIRSTGRTPCGRSPAQIWQARISETSLRRFIVACISTDEHDRNADIELGPIPICGHHRASTLNSKRQAGAVAKRKSERPGRGAQMRCQRGAVEIEVDEFERKRFQVLYIRSRVETPIGNL